MKNNDREKTAFSCSRAGLYELKVMPFGLSTAPATFERLMEVAMRGIQLRRCLVYLDDVVTIGKDFDEAIKSLQLVCIRLRQAGLKLKPSKCSLLRTEVRFLGHLVSQEGVRCDPKKIEAVKEYERPETVTYVRAFLGFVGYYRRFIERFADRAAPLYLLLQKGQPFTWGTRAGRCFQRVERAINERTRNGLSRPESTVSTRHRCESVRAGRSTVTDARWNRESDSLRQQDVVAFTAKLLHYEKGTTSGSFHGAPVPTILVGSEIHHKNRPRSFEVAVYL